MQPESNVDSPAFGAPIPQPDSVDFESQPVSQDSDDAFCRVRPECELQLSFGVKS